MFEQDAPDFPNSLGLALHRVPPAYDQFRFHPLNMGTFILDDPVAALLWRAVPLNLRYLRRSLLSALCTAMQRTTINRAALAQLL